MNINKKSIVFIVLSLVAFVSSLIYITLNQNRYKTGTVVILNGISSSGKTSIINELKKIYGDAYKIIDIDTFTNLYIASHPISKQLESKSLDEKAKKQIVENYEQTFVESFYSLIKDEALKGRNILVDTVPVRDADVEYGQIVGILKGINTIKVLLYCPLNLTVVRIKQRNLTGIPEEHREVMQPVSQYSLLYKQQESESEVIDKILSKDMKQLHRSAIDSFMKALPDEFKDRIDEVAKGLEDLYKEFVQQFKLDELKEVNIVSKKPYDLILDCRHTPMELAKEIENFLKQ